MNPGPGLAVVVRARLQQCPQNAVGSKLMGAVGPGAPDHQHRGECMPEFEAAGAKPGLVPGQGARGLRLVR